MEQTTPEARDLQNEIDRLVKIVAAQNKHLDLLTGFLIRGTWFEDKKGAELIEQMENSSMLAEAVDAVESSFDIEGPILGLRLRRY